MHRGECVTTGGLYGPHSPVCSTLELHKKSSQYFLWWGKVWGGGGGSMFSGGRGLHGVSEGGWGDLSSGLSQPGGKSCWAVWRSGLWCSGTVFLMVGAGRDCGRGGWGPSRCGLFGWCIVQGECPGGMGEGHRWPLQPCSLSAGGSCGQQHCSSRTDSDAAGQHTLNGAPVECGEDGWWETCSFHRRRKCRRCCAFLESDMVLVVQVRSSVMCTPRNLVLLTLSTVELSMVSGGWSVEFLLLKSITTSFVFSTFRDRLLTPHHSASCATSSL